MANKTCKCGCAEYFRGLSCPACHGTGNVPPFPKHLFTPDCTFECIESQLSTGAQEELITIAERKAGPWALVNTSLENLGLVQFLKETRSGTTWWKATPIGRIVTVYLLMQRNNKKRKKEKHK